MSILPELFQKAPRLFIQQSKAWLEILTNFESSNKYTIFDENKNQLGFIAEQSGGIAKFLFRWILKSHRGFEIKIFDHSGNPILHLSRRFFFFFSDLTVHSATGEMLGQINRRFGIIYKKYDLLDATGNLIARIKSPLWRLWTFSIIDSKEQVQGSISKKWGGGLRELFTDADTFLVDFGNNSWTHSQKAILLAAAISVDFDFFEENQGTNPIGMLDI